MVAVSVKACGVLAVWGLVCGFEVECFYEVESGHGGIVMECRGLKRGWLDAFLIRRPDEFVHLKLEANVESVLCDPFDDGFGIDEVEDRGNEDGVASIDQIVCFNFLFGPVVVFTIRNDEFHFVFFGEFFDVGVVVFFGFSGAWAFEVHDGDSFFGEVFDGQAAGGFDEYGVVFIDEGLGEVNAFGLCERFSAGDFDEGTFVFAALVEDGVDGC